VTHETDLGTGEPESLPVSDPSDVPDVSDIPVAMAGDRASEPVVRQPRHFACFDGLRAIAAVSVLLLHTAWESGFTSRSSLGAYTSRLEIGVSVFFLISGFLLYRPFAVSHLTGRTPPNRRRFWERRLLRIVPAYWLALTVLTYMVHVVSVGAGWKGFFAHYFFLQIYFPTQVFDGITQAWSLCTEMSFYLVLPFYAAAIAYRRRSPKNQLFRELIGLVVLYAISFGFRYWILHQPLLTVKDGKFVSICAPHCATNPPLATLMIDWLPAYLDMFALGMLLAVTSAWFAEHGTEPAWLRHRLMPWVSWLGAALAFVTVSHVVTDHDIFYFVIPRVNLERQALYGLFAFLLLLPAVFGPQDRSLVRRFLRSWPMASLGVISYGIYLWHLDLISEVDQWTGWNAGHISYWMLAGLVLAVTVLIASASYFGLERPLLLLKDRISWWDGPARRVGTASGPGAAPVVHASVVGDPSAPDVDSGPQAADDRP
jgi:peptidoglycan/LPS O-acetylase OafA/YrhL